MKIMITGGAGFIGSAVIRQYMKHTDHEVINFDALTYAGNLVSLETISTNPKYHFEHADIRHIGDIQRVIDKYQPDAIIHLAAESHVDRSIDKPADFIQTNIIGTYNLLEVTKRYWDSLKDSKKKRFRLLHVSTDEVYGDLGETGMFTEDTPYSPSSPYSASKASSDHLVRAWHKTYGLPTVITNCSNNYGNYQFPEKLIPMIILNALEGKPLPIYGKGNQIRDWLHVDDHAKALRITLEKGKIGDTYNIGGHNEKTNIDVVKTICSLMDKIMPDSNYVPHESLIAFVTDRPGHDMRYAINAEKIANELGWIPEETFETGLEKTIKWYLENTEWCKCVQDGSYQRERLGSKDITT